MFDFHFGKNDLKNVFFSLFNDLIHSLNKRIGIYGLRLPAVPENLTKYSMQLGCVKITVKELYLQNKIN